MTNLSSFKKKMAKRKYKERSQPKWRADKGFLEKEVDYKKRAKKYKQNQEMLKKLYEKSSVKNEDEFYFKMVNSKINVV